jgi:hypothetical protein
MQNLYMENHEHRIPNTTAQINQFTGHMTLTNIGGGTAEVGSGGSTKEQFKSAFWTALVVGWRGFFQ